MKYPNRLKEIRNSLGLTLQQVADRMDKKCIDRLSEWERGINMPSVLNLITLLKIYEVSIEEIYPELLNISVN
ncbi:helix-turn-helix transcriptional regulator [Emticicia sp. BO119]|uniref:helix-turn-helix domain-containing protein n=1 Tax=Emticicia sp. BO119 TaxID=2757768 RepID=UPI0015F01463|nr:helix-turn-helix transcriptional regulator [Emticicia sp. BO119]MBA4850474.1 helix-turn-helix transcriptional regulator [Emticicia sp. BO119]